MTTIVDASVVLAWLQDEPGGDVAEPHLMEGIIGAANWSEVLRKARQHGASIETTARLLNSFGLRVVEVTKQDAEVAACLDPVSSPLGLADRLCLALGKRLNLPVATADRAWLQVPNRPEVIPIR